MIVTSNKDKGRAGLSIAIGYYGSSGYTVCLPLNDTQDYDFIIDDGLKLQKVQVKCTGFVNKYGRYEVPLRSCGGTKGRVYKYVKDSDVDILFVVCTNGWLFAIPKEEIYQKTAINLCNKEYDQRPRETDYSKYLVSFDVINPIPSVQQKKLKNSKGNE